MNNTTKMMRSIDCQLNPNPNPISDSGFNYFCLFEKLYLSICMYSKLSFWYHRQTQLPSYHLWDLFAMKVLSVG